MSEHGWSNETVAGNGPAPLALAEAAAAYVNNPSADALKGVWYAANPSAKLEAPDGPELVAFANAVRAFNDDVTDAARLKALRTAAGGVVPLACAARVRAGWPRRCR